MTNGHQEGVSYKHNIIQLVLQSNGLFSFQSRRSTSKENVKSPMQSKVCFLINLLLSPIKKGYRSIIIGEAAIDFKATEAENFDAPELNRTCKNHLN